MAYTCQIELAQWNCETFLWGAFVRFRAWVGKLCHVWQIWPRPVLAKACTQNGSYIFQWLKNKTVCDRGSKWSKKPKIFTIWVLIEKKLLIAHIEYSHTSLKSKSLSRVRLSATPCQNTGVDGYVLLQGIFLNQRLLRLLCWQAGFFTTSATWKAHCCEWSIL